MSGPGDEVPRGMGERAGPGDVPTETVRSHLGVDPFEGFADGPDRGRRLRGRLVAPVTVWTAGSGENRAGLTVSSCLVAEGEPAEVLGLIGDLTDLYAAILEAGTSTRWRAASGSIRRRISRCAASTVARVPPDDCSVRPIRRPEAAMELSR